eukprot:2008064-Prymnesium_polylepis.1
MKRASLICGRRRYPGEFLAAIQSLELQAAPEQLGEGDSSDIRINGMEVLASDRRCEKGLWDPLLATLRAATEAANAAMLQDGLFEEESVMPIGEELKGIGQAAQAHARRMSLDVESSIVSAVTAIQIQRAKRGPCPPKGPDTKVSMSGILPPSSSS